MLVRPENFHFLEVNNSVYLNRLVFVMFFRILSRKQALTFHANCLQEDDNYRIFFSNLFQIVDFDISCKLSRLEK